MFVKENPWDQEKWFNFTNVPRTRGFHHGITYLIATEDITRDFNFQTRFVYFYLFFLQFMRPTTMVRRRMWWEKCPGIEVV